MASTSQKSTLSACFNTSATPDCFEITTGTLARIASSGTMPNGSETEGITNTSLKPNILSIASPFKNPVKWNLSAIRSLATRSIILFSISPEPAITKRTLLSFCRIL